ncbi:hypothetical protein [Aurantimonas sp. VKM B-3413]|uniref:hypothetical protein n=1 Tax=Aurantimonas sp. VKM B-3413 TaxID=2779401 RepID=UPI001E64CAD5|nr:hypothetical protein [Aurantimonas sp. VKM B-3413]MCB8837685.1 hypothetical protein [Aurantimonas sp. VKM B-3413]
MLNAATSLAVTPSAHSVLPFPAGRCPTAAATVPTLVEAERDELNRLRWLALKSRLAPRPDVERACLLLASEANVSLERFGIAFFRALSDTASRGMSFYRPGARDLSDDEIWLMRLVAAWRAGEERAAGALIAWRVEPKARRWLRFLSASLARTLQESPFASRVVDRADGLD